jgi:hypothetical protein
MNQTQPANCMPVQGLQAPARKKVTVTTVSIVMRPRQHHQGHRKPDQVIYSMLTAQ